MGSNLALNLAEHGVRVAVHDRKPDHVRAFAERHAAFTGAETLAELAGALASPRRILLLIPAGRPVDDALDALAPLLSSGDVVLDGGNSHYLDTRRRGEALAARGIRFLGMGVSGGAEGARHGPALMPGGPPEAYEAVRPLLETVAARTELGPCVAYLGPDGAGHFVKMVHNGIEYADMQAIAEAYDLLRRVGGLDAPALAAAFAAWNEGPLASFLMEITAGIFTVRDESTGRALVEEILDEAEQKGTGRWTVTAALEMGVPAPVIAAAVDARVVSSRREERRRASEILGGPAPGVEKAKDAVRPDMEAAGALAHAARDAVHAARLCAHAQGMELIRAASDEHGWGVPRDEVARIWMAGSILRARVLGPVREALRRDPETTNLLLDFELAREIESVQAGLREAVGAAARHGVPAPCWSAALAWYDSTRSARLPVNLTQAQRDWFGAHSYRRLDDPGAPPVRTPWAERARPLPEVPR
jgi:6-phosphogluconate dehydrogenase